MAEAPPSFLTLYDFALKIAQTSDHSSDDEPFATLCSEAFGSDLGAEKAYWDRLNYKSRLGNLITKIQESEELRHCEKDLLPRGLGVQSEGTISGGVFSTAGRGKWICLVPLHDLLDRLGIYHDVLSASPADAAWSRIDAALHNAPIQVTTLLELLGCDFPQEFQILGCHVVGMSDEKQLALGSRGRMLATSLHREVQVDGSDRHLSWYLAKTQPIEHTTVSHLNAPLATCEQILDRFWGELLVLALCSPGRFTISNVSEANPGWEMATVSLVDPYTNASFVEYLSPKRSDIEWSAWAEKFYGVATADWAQFQRSVELFTRALRTSIRRKTWELESLHAVAQWYLRGRLMEHSSLNDGEYADVLIRYVTCLENLVMLRDEKEAIADKLTSRLAWMVGRHDTERDEVRAFVKSVYDARSKTVHRQTKKKKHDVDFQRLSDICRRAIACALIIAEKATENGHLDQFLRRLTTSSENSRRAEAAARQIGSLTRCL